MSDTADDKQMPWRFQPGQSGNPAGRPKGSRNKLQEDFLKALSADFEVHGVAAIQEMREKDTSGYVKVVASLLPKQMEINETLELIGDAELVDVVTALRAAIAAGQAGVGAKQATKGKQAKELQAVH